MKNGIAKYELSNFLYSGKEITPIIIFLCWLRINYSIGPVDLLKSFGLSALVIFIITLTIGISYANMNHQMIDQAYYVKLQKKHTLYTSKLVVILFLSVILSTLGMLIPIITQIVSKTLFMRTMTFIDFISCFFLLFFASLCGGITGQFANKRIIKNFRVAIIFGMLVGLLSLVKGGLHQEFPLTKFFTWILPPIFDLSKLFCDYDYLPLQRTLLYFIWIIFYILALSLLYVKLMLHRKFE